MDVVEIPTNKPISRLDKEDSIYATESAKFNAIADQIEELNKTGQPVLVGTISIERSEIISALLKRRGVKHNVLNAKQHEREAEIVARSRPACHGNHRDQYGRTWYRYYPRR